MHFDSLATGYHEGRSLPTRESFVDVQTLGFSMCVDMHRAARSANIPPETISQLALKPENARVVRPVTQSVRATQSFLYSVSLESGKDAIPCKIRTQRS